MLTKSKLTSLLAWGAFIVLALAAEPLFALKQPAPPYLPQAESAILIEAETGKVLYSYHPDIPIPPASLTKLVTLEIALHLIRDGVLNPNAVIVPVEQAWASSMPPHSSLMFLGPNQRLTVNQLLTGMIVDSGNDAAYEVAYLVAGGVPAFADLMNQEVAQLGFPKMHFVEPSGISGRNVITAREFAYFCRQFIAAYPNALPRYFRKHFTYPEPSNLTGGSADNPIFQRSRNSLLWSYSGADGLKTGYITESGYNMAATAVRHGMRLISVVLGIRSTPTESGPRLMALDSEALLNYGFDNFTKLSPSYPTPEPVAVWEGAERNVMIAPAAPAAVVVSKSEASSLTVSVHQARAVLAPVTKGTVLGEIDFKANGASVGTIPLEAEASVYQGGFVTRTAQSVALFFMRLVGANPISPWRPTQSAGVPGAAGTASAPGAEAPAGGSDAVAGGKRPPA